MQLTATPVLSHIPLSSLFINLLVVVSVLTGIADVEIAKNYLEACGGNIEMAISMHMDNAEAGDSHETSVVSVF